MGSGGKREKRTGVIVGQKKEEEKRTGVIVDVIVDDRPREQ